MRPGSRLDVIKAYDLDTGAVRLICSLIFRKLLLNRQIALADLLIKTRIHRTTRHFTKFLTADFQHSALNRLL